MPIKTDFVIGFRISPRGIWRYLFSTQKRTFDNKNIITPTDDLTKAKGFITQKEATDFLSTCITNEKPWEVMPRSMTVREVKQ